MDIENEDWGYWLGDVWISLPKESLTSAGYTDPPFEVTRPDGRVLQVVARKSVDS